MFCPNCGTDVQNSKFCPNCGAKVEEEKKEVTVDAGPINETKPNSDPIVLEENKSTTPLNVVETTSSNDSNSSNNTQNTNNQTVGGVEYSTKSKIAAGLFGIFFGVFGVHNFYLGYTGRAIAQLLISILSCGFLAVVSEIWGLVEGIMILATKDYKDAQGKILKD